MRKGILKKAAWYLLLGLLSTLETLFYLGLVALGGVSMLWIFLWLCIVGAHELNCGTYSTVATCIEYQRTAPWMWVTWILSWVSVGLAFAGVGECEKYPSSEKFPFAGAARIRRKIEAKIQEYS